MKPIYSKAGLARLDEIVRPGVLCAFDFDGTLAPIARQPAQAQVPPQVLRALVALANYAPVAIITGRSRADTRERLRLRPALDFEPAYIVGNHGLEGVPDCEAHAARYAQTCRIWMKALSASLQQKVTFAPGMQIEDKQYSLSLHYRLAPDHVLAEAQLMKLCDALDPAPRIVKGKCVINLMPRDAPNKGSAIEQLMQKSGARRALYVGDDVTDEDVFTLARDDLLSIRIERATESAASYFLNYQMEILSFLEELVRRLRSQVPHGSAREAACDCGAPRRISSLAIPLSTKG